MTKGGWSRASIDRDNARFAQQCGERHRQRQARSSFVLSEFESRQEALLKLGMPPEFASAQAEFEAEVEAIKKFGVRG